MKVHELIEKLNGMPSDAEVFVYSMLDEGDCHANDVKICNIAQEDDYDDPYDYNPDYPEMKQYYCQGDSYALEYLLRNKNNESSVVVIGSFCNC